MNESLENTGPLVPLHCSHPALHVYFSELAGGHPAGCFVLSPGRLVVVDAQEAHETWRERL